MKTTKTLRLVLLALSLGAIVTGCAASTEPPPPTGTKAANPVAEALLKKVGTGNVKPKDGDLVFIPAWSPDGSGATWSCAANGPCFCRGDFNCNGMYSSGVCSSVGQCAYDPRTNDYNCVC